MKTKKCNGCNSIKNVTEFHKCSRVLNGYNPRCKLCCNSYYNNKYEAIKNKKSDTSKKRYVANKDKILKQRKVYYEKNKDKIIKRNKFYVRRRKIEYPYLKKIASFRSLVKKMLKNREYSTFKYLGYSFDDLINKLGRLPKDNEHIDHKIPITWFEKSTELKIIFSLDNLQILSATENISKGNRYCHNVSEDYYKIIKPHIKEKFINKIKYGK